jgi:hypothetical protein
MLGCAKATFGKTAQIIAGGWPVLRGLARPFTWSYWFAPGCRLSYCAARIVLALLYLYLANQYAGYFSAGAVDVDAYLAGRNPGMYHPLSWLCMFGKTPPPPWFYKAALILLKVCPIALLLGFFSRLSLLGCMAGLFGLGIMYYSYELEWSHGFSPILVASFPLLLGPAPWDGFDGWWRRRRGRFWGPADDRRARGTVMATQLLVSLVFLNAAFYKCYAYGQGSRHFLPWVLSDNLRNVIIRQHVVFDVPIEEPFQFIVSHEFAYKGLALTNLLAQALPFAALFFMNRPYLRFLCGLALVSEVIGLGVVMGIWNLHWLLFVFFFLDWDRLLACLSRNSAAAPAVAMTPVGWPALGRAELGQALALAILLGFNGYVMFKHIEQRPWTFPFTSYPMFSGVVADAPLGKHLPYYIPVSRFDFDADKPLSQRSLHDNWLYYWGATWVPDVRELGKQIVRTLQARNSCTIHEMTAYRALLRVAEYPACELKEVFKLPVYCYTDGRIHTVAGVVKYDADRKCQYLEYQAHGFDNPQVRVKYVDQEGHGPFDLPGDSRPGRFYFTRPSGARVVVVFEVQDAGGASAIFGGPML